MSKITLSVHNTDSSADKSLMVTSGSKLVQIAPGFRKGFDLDDDLDTISVTTCMHTPGDDGLIYHDSEIEMEEIDKDKFDESD